MTLLALAAASQDLPGKIRGYSLYRTDIQTIVRMAGDPVPDSKHDLLITIDRPEISGMGLSGARFAVTGEIISTKHEGSIDLVMFRDFTVNGVPVTVEEHSQKFKLTRKHVTRLAKPVIVRAGPQSIARIASQQLRKADDRWRIEGTVLVFGKFRRFGFGFKRVIPIRVTAVIADPLLD